MRHDAGCLLILDDDAAVARTLSLVADALGFAVHCFDAPRHFLDAIPALSPSHLALDLIVPEMDGVEILRRLAQSGCGAALILISGMGQKVLDSARATAARRGLNVVGVLPKPFGPQRFSELLKPRRTTACTASISMAAPCDVAPEALAEAIAQARIAVAVEAKLDLDTRRVVGAEILARWNDAHLGPIPPDVFVRVAENHGLIQDLTHLVIEQALAWFSGSRLRAHGDIAVNLSAGCLGDVGLADRLQALCDDARVPADRLTLELTESAAVDYGADSLDTLTRLRLKGFRLSMDDFGTGYSSMMQLVQLPLSEIKIDRCFVSRLHGSEDARKIVDASIRLASSMNLISVAEGVESAALLETLASMGCELAQGHHICRPLAGPDFDAWLRQG